MCRDEYETGAHRFWHLSTTPPELATALDRRDAPRRGRALDLGCGLGTEVAALAQRGFRAAGVDLSRSALGRARAHQPRPRTEFVRADVRALPFADGAFDLLIDRGCLHYLPAAERPRYVGEAARLLRPEGRFLLRACTRSSGRRNGIGTPHLRRLIRGWRMLSLFRASIPSDTRSLPSLVAWLAPPPIARTRPARVGRTAKYRSGARRSARLDRGVGRPLTHRNRP